jgi:general secretion pathway protein F
MPSFEYTAINQKGHSKKGTIDADSLRLARQKLRERGIFPTSIKESKTVVVHKSQDIGKFFQRNHISTKELAILTRQLATLVGAGLPLISALTALTDQTDSQLLKRMIVDIKEDVEGGSSLAKAFGAFPKSFPRLYTNMVAAGEASGLLDKVLNNLADYLEGQLVLRSKLKKALTYPIMMMILCVIVIAVLMVFVVPKIVEIFDKKGAVLPLPTRIVMWC